MGHWRVGRVLTDGEKKEQTLLALLAKEAPCTKAWRAGGGDGE